jgi:hypothetical protein
MIHDRDLPTFLWIEACNTAVYIQNRCPHKILEDKIPNETFTGVKPEVSHFHIFGCLVYIHVPVEKRTKLKPSSKNDLFVGYSETSEAYKVFIPKQRKIVISRDVRFEEYFASKKSCDPIPMTKDEEQEVPKVELGSTVASSLGKQPSSEEETLAPSTSVMRPRWFTQTLRDVEEYVEAPRSTFREIKPMKKFLLHY